MMHRFVAPRSASTGPWVNCLVVDRRALEYNTALVFETRGPLDLTSSFTSNL